MSLCPPRGGNRQVDPRGSFPVVSAPNCSHGHPTLIKSEYPYRT
jgi:hypothetical protein